jgi:hypothetical protein
MAMEVQENKTFKLDIEALTKEFEKLQVLEKFFKQKCVVTYWKKSTFYHEGWEESNCTVRDAIFLIKQGYFERATLRLDIE